MQFVIFHGAFGLKNGNWFPWLKTELEKSGHEVILEQYPVDDMGEITKKGKENKDTLQNLDNWLTVFKKTTLPRLNKNETIIFVGHSLAPVFILHVVDRFKIALEKAIFISPFLEGLKGAEGWQFDVVNRTFHKTDFDWLKLKKLIPKSYVVYGEKDPYVPTRFPLDFAAKMSSTIIPVKNGGHLGGELKEFPLLLNLIQAHD